ncbi:MAG: hypothetical protein A2079_01200 [Geobacteraceae bacterium GWC2_48_7]|nr:MAG: hypothetical protein A2079_01200 [Geobacteraceae bacterium GWC2_48_7]
MDNLNKILIVDDEADIALILKLHLEDAGYETSWANEGSLALAMLAEEEYAAMLLDVKMPGMSGIEVLEQIKKNGKNVAVIMMTAHGNESFAVECMKAGALDYFVKPFDMSDILQRIARAISFHNAVIHKERLEREKDDFVSMLSHDMKNPLAAVIGSIDIMREGRLGPVNSEQVEYLQSAIESCNEVVAMIDNLLDIHRFEAGCMQMLLRAINPPDLIMSATQRFIVLAGHEQIHLSVELEKDLPYIVVDINAFTRIIGNLLGNAIKFTPSGGKITVRCRTYLPDDLAALNIPEYAHPPGLLNKFKKHFCLSVKDNGPGIPPEEHSQIFNRFVQSRKNTKMKVGTGLGLAFCKMAIESFGGIIWVNSTEGAGSEFIFLLPGHDAIDAALNDIQKERR